MTLAKLLGSGRKALAARWLELTLGTYPRETARFLSKETNEFANPVGQTLASELRELTDAVLDGTDPGAMCEPLEAIIKVRAFQGQSPSEVMSFVFLLKKAIREQLGRALDDARRLRELAEFEARVDQLALFAFDILAKTRDQMWQMRVDEVKRSVSAILRRIDWIDTGDIEPGETKGPPEPSETS